MTDPRERAGGGPAPSGSGRSWVTRTVVGIALATLLSDFSHEMATAVLPLHLATLGLGPAALGVIEGLADFLVSLSKLGGGVAGHYVRRKRELTSLGYVLTALGTGAIALSQTLAGILTCRSVAWVARGFRGPLRDDLLANAVEPTHYGRAYGLERAGDMAGAVAGPLAATLLVAFGVSFRTVILWTLIPGVGAAAELLPAELRSLGFGILASANAVGDMVSSLYVGGLLQAGRPGWAFGIAAGVGLLGVIWLRVLVGVRSARPATAP